MLILKFQANCAVQRWNMHSESNLQKPASKPN